MKHETLYHICFAVVCALLPACGFVLGTILFHIFGNPVDPFAFYILIWPLFCLAFWILGRVLLELNKIKQTTDHGATQNKT